MTHTPAQELEHTVYLIDAANEIVQARKCVSPGGQGKLIGGLPETVLRFGNGDMLRVDREGVAKADANSRGFQLDGRLFIGNGIVVGRLGVEDPAMPLERLRPRVHFMAVRTTHGRAGE